MNLSLIICTWNNSNRLADTLEAICACDIDVGLAWELIIVDNNSTDDTRSVVSSFEARLPIIYLFESVQGKSRALNAALRVARGDLFLFTDDDVRPCHNWIDVYWTAYLERPDRTYFGGPVRSLYEGPTLEACLVAFAPWSVKGLDWGTVDHTPENLNGLLAANWACPAEAIRRVGLFDPSLGLNSDRELRVGEETDMMQRLRLEGWQPWYLARARIEHVVPAEKVSLDHIAARAAASSTLLASRESAVDSQKILKAFARSILSWAGYFVSRIMMKDWKPNYVTYRTHRGRAAGYVRARLHGK